MQAINLFEFDKYHKLPATDVDGFKSYLDDVWKTRNRFRYEVDETKQEVSEEEQATFGQNKQRFISFDGSLIRARNYVGFIQYEGQRINIYPKICKDKSHSSILKHLFYWLSYSKRIRFPFAQLPLDKEFADDWLEALIYIFAHQTEETLNNQPYQAYQEVTEGSSFLRGRLAMNEYITNNLSRGRYQYLYCTYEPFLFDNQFNRVVKCVTRLLLSVSSSTINQEKLHSILFLLDGVSDEYCQASDCDLVKLNPLYQELNVILEMCRMFLESTSISTNDSLNSNFCLLLPMEVIFEDFIFGFIEKHLSETKPKSQKETFLTNDRVFKMKTDIVLKNPQMIIDTKYKIRQHSADLKQGISQADMYQMLAYAYRRGVQNVLLIYPATRGDNTAHFSISDSLGKNPIINISAMDVEIYSDESLSNLEVALQMQLLRVLCINYT